MTEQPERAERPTRNRTRAVAIVMIAAAALVATGSVGLIAGARLAGSDSPATTASPNRTPVAVDTQDAGPAMDERSACMALVPVLSDAADVITIVLDTPTASAVQPEKDKLDAATRDLQNYVQRIPEHLRFDVQVIIDGLKEIEKLRMGNSYNFRSSKVGASAIAIATRCQKYAS